MLQTVKVNQLELNLLPHLIRELKTERLREFVCSILTSIGAVSGSIRS